MSAGAREGGATGRPLVSVVVNNYNYARYLGEAIDSALAQSWAPLEVVVVDDGSTDDSRAVIARYGDRILPVLQENGGQAAAFNAGFRAARGDFVLFLDADDVLLPEAVERGMACFAPGVVKVHWPVWEIDHGGARTGRLHPPKPLGEGDLLERTLLEGPLGGNSPPTSGNLYARAFLDRVMPVPEEEFRINTDGYLVTLAWIYGEVRILAEPQTLYRVHGANHFVSKPEDQKHRRHLEKFVHQCVALASHLRALGREPRLGAWKRRKGFYDPDVVAAAKEEIAALVPPGTRYVLLDEEAWAEPGGEPVPGRRAIPFLERDGRWWGRPEDDATAIREIQRLHLEGAEYLVIPWFSWWWLGDYPGFNSHLWRTFRHVVWSDFVVVFDLRWTVRVETARKEMADIMPAGARYVLIDDAVWADGTGAEPVAGREALRFMERDGSWWGRPADDPAAIEELERLLAGGAEYVVLPWFSRWWGEHYPGLLAHVQARGRCIDTSHLLVFDLHWEQRERAVKEQLAGLLPEGCHYILVDENAWVSAADALAGRRGRRFAEQGGVYQGTPADDAAAIEELQRLRGEGAEYIAFLSYTAWYLEHYTGFADHLRATAACVAAQEHFTLFRLEAR